MIFNILIILFLMFTTVHHSYALPVETTLDSDSLIYNKDKEQIVAKGAVVLAQSSQTLNADEIIYNVKDDFAYAQGNVVLKDSDGGVHKADVIELSDQMRKGMLENLYSVLEDDSRLWAKTAVKKSEEISVLNDAKYTPCKACETDPNKTPSWAIRANTVTHDKTTAMVSYESAWLEAWGVPVFYTPFFSHPDGSILQKSGFIAPQFGFGSNLGFNAMVPYYWAIAPDMDATIGVRAYTKSNPQLNLEFRKRYEDAAFTVSGSTAYSERTDSVNNLNVKQNEKLRGHFDLDAQWDMTQKWRSGTDISLVSDEQYLNQYDISDKDVLTNRIYAERFDNRDYASVQALAFQDLRIEEDVDQPNALPIAEMSFIGKPNSLGGGRFQWDTSFLSLLRDGSKQDVNRVSSELAWQRQDILPVGLTSKLDLSMRGDSYYTNDRDIAKLDPTENNSAYDSRAIPTANLELAYPLQKQLTRGQIRVKPKFGITARPDVDNDSDIPNEDSTDAQIDMNNLFEPDRFPGLDRVEDRTHINYAVETGYYKDNGDEITFAVGQSYRIDGDDNPFAEGSGFEEQKSDIVGEVGASFNDHRDNINYKFQIDGGTLYADRHELYGSTMIDKTEVSAIYLYDKGVENSEFEESREQVSASVAQPIDENWKLLASTTYDLGEDKGLRKSAVGLSYDNDCFGVTSQVERDLQSDASGEDDTSIFVRLRLKNLGEFETKTDISNSSSSVNEEDK